MANEENWSGSRRTLVPELAIGMLINRHIDILEIC